MTVGEQLVKVATELGLLAPQVADIHKRLVRMERLGYGLVGALGLLEFARGCH